MAPVECFEENPVIEFATPNTGYLGKQAAGTVVTYNCDYAPIESPESVTSTCQLDGTWTVDAECVNKHYDSCENESPIFSYATTNDFAFGHNLVGQILSYTCYYDEMKTFNVEVKNQTKFFFA